MDKLMPYIVKLDIGPTFRVMAFSMSHAIQSAAELCKGAKVVQAYLEPEWTEK